MQVPKPFPFEELSLSLFNAKEEKGGGKGRKHVLPGSREGKKKRVVIMEESSQCVYSFCKRETKEGLSAPSTNAFEPPSVRVRRRERENSHKVFFEYLWRFPFSLRCLLLRDTRSAYRGTGKKRVPAARIEMEGRLVHSLTTEEEEKVGMERGRESGRTQSYTSYTTQRGSEARDAKV